MHQSDSDRESDQQNDPHLDCHTLYASINTCQSGRQLTAFDGLSVEGHNVMPLSGRGGARATPDRK